MDRKALAPVLVTWKDAESTDEWEELQDSISSNLPIIYTIGFLLKTTEDLIIVAKNFDLTNDKVSQVMKIPKGMIVEVKQITLP